MNIHHLELFYHVAVHRGIGLAVRHMPYGIQQPAVSSQLIDLEKSLGTVLFQRRPFALTPQGAEVFQFISPFFSNLPQISRRLQGNAEPLLRLASTPTIIRHHLPPPLKVLRKRFPKFKLAIREIEPGAAEPLLQRQELDVAISFWERAPVGGIKFQKLGSLQMAIVVPESATAKSADQAIRHAIQASLGLISLPAETSLTKSFQHEAARRKLAWKQTIEVNSLDLIQAYVMDGFGYGLSVVIPGAPVPKGLKMIPLRGYPLLTIGLFWSGKLAPIAEAFSQEMQSYVTALLKPK